ncbi:putative Alkaline-phosphatase-like protein [Seiridium unicorne]|uniref:GPI ethanolamine phosphate transferase 2 n=1 Tax=Seiridium unicorne TaxID=138068 RepID=A0ABR2V2Q9_9PEZI
MQHRGSTLAARILLVAANLLIPVAILTFATGFFPYKPFLAGLAQYEDLGYGPPPAAPFDRLVFMVVDALRSDFVFAQESGFQFTQRLIQDGFALPFTAHAASPTVTMPRLKAITTGSIPSFLDVILNLDEADSSSTLASQDTWLAQMKAKKTGKLVMYGDDTWLKLFPDTFDRADGTSSFFVSDFTEVDNNVTRHIDTELRQDDWNTMVLHYLGLDHIGHKSGPRRHQREMDGIVRRIYEAMETESHLQSTLLVLCGDHGMNDAGNHGASSAGETSPALVFMSPHLKPLSKSLQVPASYVEDFQYYSRVAQSDLAPTLGALLGFPVPKNNLGAFISEFLPLWPNRRDQEQILMQNARQIFGIVAAASGISSPIEDDGKVDCSQSQSSADELACQWHNLARASQLNGSQASGNDEWGQHISKWLREAQRVMSSMASNYDTTRLTIGVIVALVSIFLSLVASVLLVKGNLGALFGFAMITLLYGIMMFASSYVEEEQHFWYWSITAWIVYLSRPSTRKWTFVSASAAGIVVISLRLIRGWNQTGQKFAGSPDLVKLFLIPQPQLLWCLIIGTYAMVTIELLSRSKGFVGAFTQPLIIGLVGAAVSFKIAFTNEDAPEIVVGFAQSLMRMIDGPALLDRARAVFIGLALASIYPAYLLARREETSSYSGLKFLHGLYTVLALTQSRATNIPLFLLFRILQAYLERLDLGIVEITTSSLLLQLASFFAMGGSNAISSVDLSNAYNG